MNDRLKDMAEVYSRAFKESLSKINKIYVTFIVILIRAFFVNYKFRGLVGGNLGGLIFYFVDAFLLCFVVQALKSFVVYGNPGKKSIGNSVSNFWQPVLNTMFFVYLIQMLIRLIAPGLSYNAYMIFIVLFEFATSALLEEIYINNKSGFDAIKVSFKFVCDNILTYGLFAFLCLMIEFYININLTGGIGSKGFLMILLLAIAETLFYVIRGHLFKYLDSHSYRQRKFMRG